MGLDNWFIYRPPFDKFGDLKEIIQWIKTKKEPPYICVFPGNAEHWFWSLKYSVKGEVGYALWGDRASGPVSIKGLSENTGFPFKGLVDRYINALFRIEKKDGNARLLLRRDLNDAMPIIALFHVIDVGVVGIGLVTDITLDAFRNFRHWREDQGHWIIRWRMRVLWLDPGVRALLMDPGFGWRNEEELIKVLKDRITNRIEINVPRQGNTCFTNESLRKEVWQKISDIFHNDDEVKSMIKFYGHTQFPALSKQVLVGISEFNINEIVKRISEDFYYDESFIRRFISAVQFGNVLLVGPPGVGKTSLAITAARLLGGDNGYMVRVANALWFRRDVIGGETLEEGSIKWRAGMLVQAYNNVVERIKNGDNRPYFVIIDEFNRADVDKAFGDFFAIFRSPNPEDWEIPVDLIREIESYNEHIDNQAKLFIKNYSNFKDEPLKLIRVIGTMNVIDIRNLFMVGEATLRRFVIIELKCPTDTYDVEMFLKELTTLDNPIKDLIKEFIGRLRKDLSNKQLCISPGSVKNAIRLLSNTLDKKLLDANDKAKVLNYFADYLKSSLGIIVGTSAKKLEDTINRVKSELISPSEM